MHDVSERWLMSGGEAVVYYDSRRIRSSLSDTREECLKLRLLQASSRSDSDILGGPQVSLYPQVWPVRGLLGGRQGSCLRAECEENPSSRAVWARLEKGRRI